MQVKGGFSTREQARDLAAACITAIQASESYVVWALNYRNATVDRDMHPADVSQMLIHQVLQQNKSLHTDWLSTMQFQGATTKVDWLGLLGSLLAGMPRLYFVIDVELLQSGIGSSFDWSAAFVQLFRRLADQGVETVVKVALVNYRTTLSVTTLEEFDSGLIQLLEAPRRHARQQDRDLVQAEEEVGEVRISDHDLIDWLSVLYHGSAASRACRKPSRLYIRLTTISVS